MHEKPWVTLMGVYIEMIDTLGVEEGRTPFYTMDNISFIQEKLGQICPVLSGNTRDKRNALVTGMLNAGC